MIVYVIEATKSDDTSYVDAVFAYERDAKEYVAENESTKVRLEIIERRLRGF